MAASTSVPRRRRRFLRRIGLGLLMLCAVAIAYLVTTDRPRIWPYRTTLQYHLVRRWESIAPSTVERGTGTLRGTVRDNGGKPIPFARVLVAERDGTPHVAESDAAGRYRIEAVPAGSYVPVAGARGFENAAVRRGGLLLARVKAGTTVELDIRLEPRKERVVAPAESWRLDPPQTFTFEAPLPATAEERRIRFTADERPNQVSFYYTPVGGPARLPVLLAVYPGPADTWKQVSLPLAQAGYAVIAVGPEYALDLEPDIDDLVRVLDRLDAGAFPRADPEQVGILAGSYSSLHVFRLLEREPGRVDAALLLGPPTDLFELRRLFEDGSFFPPFGLDQALIALGFPNQVPERYWRYSALYHARSYDVPIMLIHSKVDEVVPFTQSELLAAELDRLGKPYELHILEGMGHYLLERERTPAIDDLFKTTVDFFARELAE